MKRSISETCLLSVSCLALLGALLVAAGCGTNAEVDEVRDATVSPPDAARASADGETARLDDAGTDTAPSTANDSGPANDSLLPDAEIVAPEVSSLQVARFTTELRLTWEAPHGGSPPLFYRVVVAEGSVAPSDCVSAHEPTDVHDDRQATISALTPATEYSLRLCVVRRGQAGTDVSIGATVAVRTLELTSGEATDLVAEQKSDLSGTVLLEWKQGTGAVSYRVAYAANTTTAPPASACQTGLRVSQTKATIDNLDVNAHYAFRVCAENANPTPDLTSGVTAAVFLHTPAPADPDVQLHEISDTWARVAWQTNDGGAVVVKYDRSQAPVRCPGGSRQPTGVNNLMLTDLTPGTRYALRVCAENGDSVPLVSNGRYLSFHTRPRPTSPIRVSGLACTSSSFSEMPGILWSGDGDHCRYYLSHSTSSIPSCSAGSTQSLCGSIYDKLFGGFRARLPTLQLNRIYQLRVCYKEADGTWDQGQAIRLTTPLTVGSELKPGKCTSAESIRKPTVGFTSPAPLSIVEAERADDYPVSGSCSPDGATVTIEGDASTETSCSAAKWQTRLDLSAAGPGPVVLVARVVDAQGHLGDPDTLSLRKDTPASRPRLSLVTPPTGTPVTASNHRAFSLAGGCGSVGNAVRVSYADQLQTVSCTSNGWSVELDLHGQLEQGVTIQIDHEDALGRAASSLRRTYAVANPHPAVTILAPLDGPVGLEPGRSLPVSGTCSAANGQVRLGTSSDTRATDFASCLDNGTWEARIHLPKIRTQQQIWAEQSDPVGRLARDTVALRDCRAGELSWEHRDSRRQASWTPSGCADAQVTLRLFHSSTSYNNVSEAVMSVTSPESAYLFPPRDGGYYRYCLEIAQDDQLWISCSPVAKL